MLKVISLFIFPAILFAGNFEISLNHNIGKSFYIVESKEEQLKSELDFPFEFNALDVQLNYPIGSFDIGLSASFLNSSEVKTSKDYDWKNEEKTVFSSSKNHIDQYYGFGLEVSTDVSTNLKLLTQMHYTTLNMYWSDTYQEDYVKNRSNYISGKTLEYEQSFYEYLLGVNYQVTFLKDFTFEFKPSLLYTMAKIKDKHLVRGFYTLQNIQTFGYDITLKGIYEINSYSKINLLFNSKKFSDNHIDMNYYNQFNEKYLTLPSSYNYESDTISIGYSFSF